MVSTETRTDRRAAVLESALATFARFGYRKTSMEEVARAARISRPGLYFLFASKEDLFRAAVAHVLDADLQAVQASLGESERPLDVRLLEAFDRWAGRYVGPLTRDISAVIEDNPALLAGVVDDLPDRFAGLVERAVARTVRGAGSRRRAAEATQTLLSTSIGVKHQVETREEYRERMTVAIRLLLP